jgi:tetratricopeptide (TPR) repeat protein/DNA-binding MarR family transcriptional regulator
MARLRMSQNERLLLNLLELDRYRDSAEVPMALSQEGLAKVLRTQVHNISRALSSLEADGLVTDRLAHVRGAPRRRRAYFLTEKGRRMAEEIRAGLMKERVSWESEGKTEDVAVAEALKRASLVSGHPPSLLEVVDLARDGVSLSPSSFIERSEVADERPTVERSIGRPVVAQFFGRSEVLARIRDALDGDEISTILVHGMPGIGKSTLMSKVFDELSGRRSLFWYAFSPWDSDRGFADQLGAFLSSSGCRSVSRALKSGVPVSEIYSPLVSDLDCVDAVLFIDDLHKASEKLELMVSMLIDASRISRAVQLVLVSRTIPEYVPRDIRQSLHVELTELDRESARQIVASSSKGVSEAVIRWAHGNPLLLTLIASKGGKTERRDVIDFIDGEIYSGLTESQREVLELLSVFRHPVPLSALSEDDHDAASSLRSMSLLSEQESGVWIHDLLRDYFSSRLNADRRQRAHLRAARYCSSRQEPEWRLEALFHMVESAEWSEAAAFAVGSSESLASTFAGETLELVTAIDESAVSAEVLPRLLYETANLAELSGKIDLAISAYERSSELLADEDPTRPMALESLARLQADNEQWTKSLEAHEAARLIYERTRDVEGQVREWLNIGMLHKKRGDLAGARDCYSKAMSLSARAENRSAQAACMNNLAMLDWEMGAPGDAERMFRESVRLAHAAGDSMGEGRALENLSQFLRAFHRLDEATNLLSEASAAYARAGDIVESKRARALYCEAMATQGNFKDAVSACRSSLADPSLRRRRGLFQDSPSLDSGDFALMLTLLSILRLSGEYDEAWIELDKLMKDADRSGEVALMAKGRIEAAMIAESAGDFEKSSSLLSEAEEMLTTTVDREGLIAVYLRLGTVAEKVGSLEKARGYYESAAHQAELAGNTKALAIARDCIESVEAPR